MQLHTGDLGEHLGELGLHQLEARDRLAELDPVLGVFQRDVVGGEAWPSDSQAAPPRVAVSTRLASLKELRLREPVVRGTRTLSRVTSGCHTARLPILPVISLAV